MTLRSSSLIVAVALLAGCSLPYPSASSQPTTVAPPSGSRPATLSPSPSGPTDCGTLSVDDVPDVSIGPSGASAADAGTSGLDSGVPADRAGDWHQPDPRAGISVAAGQTLDVRAFVDPEAWLCLASIVPEVALFSPTAAAPDASAIFALPSTAASGTAAAFLSFAAPSKPGEWVVRILVTFPPSDGPARLERRFFRLRVGVPGPVVGGKASKSGACAGPGAQAPHARLSVDGKTPISGEFGSLTWRGTSGDTEDEPLGSPVDARPTSALTVTVAGAVCVGWWRIVLAPRPLIEGAFALPLEPFIDLVPSHAGDQVVAGRANSFVLDRIPAGDWVVRAEFDFADDSGGLLGQTTHYWHVVVH